MWCRAPRERVPAILVLFLVAKAVQAVVASGVCAAEDVWVEAWRHETTRPLSAIAVGDVTGDGRVDLVALSDRTVTVYALEDEGPRYVASIEGLSEVPTAVAVAPYDPGGPLNVWVGTENPGIVYVYTYDGNARRFVRRERIRYAWADIQRLIPLDLDGIGRIDLAAVTSREELVLFRWTPGGYERVSVGESGRAIRFVEARDVDGDDRKELVIARDSNHLVVLSWQIPADRLEVEEADAATPEAAGTVAKVWENYIWGTHLALFVDAFRADRPAEIVAISSQRMAHHFALTADGIAPLRTPVEWPGVVGRMIGTVDVDADGIAEIIEATGRGLVGWSLSSQVRHKETIDLSRTPVFTVARDPYAERLIAGGPWGFSVLKRVDAHHVNVVTRGAGFQPAHPTLYVDGVAYLSADDWAELLKMRLRFDPDSKQISGLKGFHFLVGRIGENRWIYNGRPKETSAPPLMHENRLYLSADFAEVVGVDFYWEPFTRTLVIDP